MTDAFNPWSHADWFFWAAREWRARRSLFGVPEELFFRPESADPFRAHIHGRALETPFGVAAGPHTQLAQNIVTAWLCGGRFIELKTVQTMDALDIPRPCIDMRDEGYNVEWSQELRTEQSLAEYARAWVAIHALHRRLGFPGDRPGAVFHASVGYDLPGLQQPNMTAFRKALQNAHEALEPARAAAERAFGIDLADALPDALSDNLTLSTMHGCPPDQIERMIERLQDEGFHASIKLNPTLLGPELLRHILIDELGYRQVEVPDEAFEHDLRWDEAVDLIRRLCARAARLGLHFGAKLTNTLEVVNQGPVFDRAQARMYLSGRALHAPAVELAARIAETFEGRLPLSFSAGVDVFNAPEVAACGLFPVTVCSDLLKTGGYPRMLQYLERLREAMVVEGAAGLRVYAGLDADDPRACDPERLRRYADRARRDPLLHRDRFERGKAKTARPLGRFDCVRAPCADTCPIRQRVPDYLRQVAEGRFADAARVIREDNPMGAVLGRACNHACEPVCVRAQIDEPLAIRDLKRAAMDHEQPDYAPPGETDEARRVAVIGGGPCGLAAAHALAAEGARVTLFEAGESLGGMVGASIPGYRAEQAALDDDLAFLLAPGVRVRTGVRVGVNVTLAELRNEGFTTIIVAGGAMFGMPLGLEGEDRPGVLDGLAFLRAVRAGRPPALGRRIGIVGGGDVAMDCARSAARLAGGGTVVIYRRTLEEMPAQREERMALMEEGIPILERHAPRALRFTEGRLSGLVCDRMRMGEPDDSGRRRPEPIPGAETEIALDTLIVAIGQRPDLSLFGAEPPRLNAKGFIDVDPATGRTSQPGVYAGGDIAGEGPSTIVQALADGRHIAAAVLRAWAPGSEPGASPDPAAEAPTREAWVARIRRLAHRELRVPAPHRPPSERMDFEVAERTYPEADARREAARCLDCDRQCAICVGVCPNRALQSVTAPTGVWPAPRIRLEGGAWTVLEERLYRIGQAAQVIVLADFCNACGNCVTFCPTAGAPWRDKPRFFFDRRAFEAEADNAFRTDRNSIEGRYGGVTHRLIVDGRRLQYGDGRLLIDLEPATLRILAAAAGQAGELQLERAAELYVLLTAARELLP